MSEMSEHVAKEIHAAVSTAHDWDTEAPTMKDFYRKCAVAAIKAIGAALKVEQMEFQPRNGLSREG